MTQVALEGLGTGPELIQAGPMDDEDSRPSRLSGIARQFAAFRALPNLATWFGVGLITVGLVLLFVAWGRTAGLTNVGLQIPYLVSAGFTGVALVLIGLTVVNIDAKRTDAAARTAQLVELRGLLAELRTAVEEDEQ
jgi:hypothetical protein